MKTFKNFISILAAVIILISCDDDSSSPQNNADLDLAHKVKEQQDDMFQILENDLASGTDTLAALNSIAAKYREDSTVSNVYVSDFGLFVEYSSGLRSGIIIDPLDEEEGVEVPEFRTEKGKTNNLQKKENKLLGKVLSKDMIFLNPSYFERSKLTEQIKPYLNDCSIKANMNYPLLLKDNDCTLDYYTKLSDYGVVHFYSHGFPYPSLDNIQEVYMYTGEIVNDQSTAKYWDRVISGELLMVKYRDGEHYYMISPGFIAKYNDFSESKTLIYGGFCFSSLGSWKSTMVDLLGASAYIGFDWAVVTGWNALWASDLYYELGDKSEAEPKTLSYWYNNINQNYESKKWKRYVSVGYKGDSDLKLWGESGLVITVNNSSPYVGEEVTFTAISDEQLPKNVLYAWDFGDYSSSSTVEIVNNNKVTYTFEEPGTFEVELRIFDQEYYDIIGEAVCTVTVTRDYSKLVQDLKYCYLRLDVDFTETGWTTDDGFGASNVDWDKLGFDHPLQWSGRTFSCNYSYRLDDENGNGYSIYTTSIQGSLSEDYLSVASLEVNSKQEYYYKGDYTLTEYVLSAANLPERIMSPEYIEYLKVSDELRNSIRNYYRYFRDVWEDGTVIEYKYESIKWEDNFNTPRLSVNFYKDNPVK